MAHHAIQPVPVSRQQRWALVLALMALAVAASWNGVLNDYTYDDRLIVLGNKALRDLPHFWRLFGQSYWPPIWGSDGYRPLTMLFFSAEWAAGAGQPWAFHAANIALYAIATAAVFLLAETCLPLAAAWVAAALFAVHPVHVEAVGNIVGQSELLVAVFLIPAVTLYIQARNANELDLTRMIVIGVLYVAAMLSKEHGIVLPALLLVAELIVVRDAALIKARFVKLRPYLLSLAAIASAYLLVHALISNEQVGGFHQYVPFSTNNVDTGGRIWTMFGVVPHWIRLFLFPARLLAEYGPPEYPVVTHFALYQVPGMIILAAFAGLVVIARRKSPPLAFGIAFALIALFPTSNFLVATGILLSERTLFLPSAGVMIAVGCIVPWVYRHARLPRMRVAAAATLALVLVAGAWRSVDRTRDWRNNDTLFDASVIDGPRVYRTHFMQGAWKFHLLRKREGEQSYQRAMALYDRDPYVYYSLAQEYLNFQMFRPAEHLLRKVIEIDTAIVEARARLAYTLMELHRWPEAEEQALLTLRHPDTKSFAVMRTILRLAAAERRKTAAGTVRPPVAADSGKTRQPGQDALPDSAARVRPKTQPPTE